MSMKTAWYLTFALLAVQPLQAAPPFEYYTNNVAPYTEQAWEAEIPLLLNRVETTGDANLRSSSGFTALQAACRVGDEALVNKLLDMGADVNARPKHWQEMGPIGSSPLGMLVVFMDEESAERRTRIAKRLLDKGADPDAPVVRAWGNKPAFEPPFSRLTGHEWNNSMRKLLLEYGEQDLKKRTMGWRISWMWCSRDTELVKKLLNGGVDPNAHVGEKSMTLMHFLLRHNPNHELIRLALEKGFDVTRKVGRNGRVASYLFNLPVRPSWNFSGSYKPTPEEIAAIATMLIEAGSPLDVLNGEGNSLRIYYGSIDTPEARAVGKVLREHGAKLHPDAR
jgi:ankyrin repeat protein